MARLGTVGLLQGGEDPLVCRCSRNATRRSSQSNDESLHSWVCARYPISPRFDRIHPRTEGKGLRSVRQRDQETAQKPAIPTHRQSFAHSDGWSACRSPTGRTGTLGGSWLADGRESGGPLRCAWRPAHVRLVGGFSHAAAEILPELQPQTGKARLPQPSGTKFRDGGTLGAVRGQSL